jgi:hypothetical protein
LWPAWPLATLSKGVSPFASFHLLFLLLIVRHRDSLCVFFMLTCFWNHFCCMRSALRELRNVSSWQRKISSTLSQLFQFPFFI